MDSLQGFMTSFRHFERKLDKLQEDVSTHGQTLTELQSMVSSLAGATTGERSDHRRRVVSTQYETIADPTQQPAKLSVPNKLKAKSFQGETKYAFKTPAAPPFRAPIKGSLPAVIQHQRLGKTDRLGKSERQAKAEWQAKAEKLAKVERLAKAEKLVKTERGKAVAPRKTTTLRLQKPTKLDKKRTKSRK